MSKDSWVLSCRRNVAFDGESVEDGPEQQGFWVFTDFEKAKKRNAPSYKTECNVTQRTV